MTSMGSGPLDHPRLLEIEDKLDRAEIDAAQRLLAELGDLSVHRTAITYFATRLLYQRGRLDVPGVVERLRELMMAEPLFPQASAMLAAAERGTLRPERLGFQPGTLDPNLFELERAAAGQEMAATQPPTVTGPSPSIDPRFRAMEIGSNEIGTDHDEVDRPPEPSLRRAARKPDFEPRYSRSMPQIPRAPMLPKFTPPSNAAPSYAPGALRESLQFELELQLPQGPTDTLSESESEPPPSSTQSVLSAALARNEQLDASVRDHGPESMLARARALWEQGIRDGALASIQRLEGAPLLDPELRADCARFLIEASEPERAVIQARFAIHDDPASPLVQLMLTWALVRAARHAPNHQTVDEAEIVLARLRAKAGPIPALAQALRASILAEKGDPDRAIATAKLALKLDPDALDAEAAISLASARLGKFADAQAAWERLRGLSALEAERMSDRLQQLGVSLRDEEPVPSRGTSSALRLWDRLEIELFNGEQSRVVAAFELDAARELRGLVGESATDAIPLLATMAAGFFTTAPIWRHFAPFDLSLASVARVEAVLDILYGRAPRAPLSAASFPAQVMLASYVGECLRQGYGGHWLGSLANPEAVFVDTDHTRFAPFHELRLRLEQGKRLLFEGAEGQHARVSGAPIAIPMSPPAPWDPAEWPSSRMLPRLGLAFSQSVVALYCADVGGPLDRSLAGLHSLDAYAALLAPEHARPSPGVRWVKRAALLIGAYLGEVLREATGAAWRDESESPTGPESYALLLPDGGSTYPVLQAFERLSGRDTAPLSRYATRLVRELG